LRIQVKDFPNVLAYPATEKAGGIASLLECAI